MPGDEAAGRVASPTVVSEVLFQEAQDSKKRASEAFERGLVDEGTRLLNLSKDRLEQALGAAPADAAPEIQAQIEEIDQIETYTQIHGASYVSKMSRDSYHRSNRKRGRRASE